MSAAPSPALRDQRGNLARISIAPIFLVAGIIHLGRPDVFVPVMPHFIPHPHSIILLTGAAEILGAIGLFVPRTRALAGAMLALYAVCVYPANISHAVHDLSTGTGLGWAYHYPRLFVQPLICWWALIAGKNISAHIPRIGRGD
ncbi:MAG: DoxX family protein [Candidatus Sphingomonas colombiensis]|nr:DoxX family protein [Sphingomonas sp.]WEK43430.1 MAG: DoxX family protein [Sphingomonas sp.]